MTIVDPKKTAIVQVACGFRSEPQNSYHKGALSIVDNDRRSAVMSHYYKGNKVVVTGRVPFTAEKPLYTIAALNCAALTEGGKVPADDVRVGEGLNAFSESYNVCRMLQQMGVKTIKVVSSDFYFAAYERMWRAAGRRNGLKVDIISVKHDPSYVSQDVRDFYLGAKAQIMSRVAASSEVGHRFAKMLADKMTATRVTEGFKIDGHTSIA